MNGNKSQPWNMSIGEFFRNAVKENSTEVFIEISGEKITYQECFDRSLQTAAMFREFGITKGDKIGRAHVCTPVTGEYRMPSSA